MKLSKLIEVASSGYPDDMVAEGNEGDSLALFIRKELTETFEEDEGTDGQLEQAIQLMGVAIKDLEGVRTALLKHQANGSANEEE